MRGSRRQGKGDGRSAWEQAAHLCAHSASGPYPAGVNPFLGPKAGLLTFPFYDAFPIGISGLSMSQNAPAVGGGCRNLQQRELFGSCTRFPFHPDAARLRRAVGTLSIAKIRRIFQKAAFPGKIVAFSQAFGLHGCTAKSAEEVAVRSTNFVLHLSCSFFRRKRQRRRKAKMIGNPPPTSLNDHERLRCLWRKKTRRFDCGGSAKSASGLCARLWPSFARSFRALGMQRFLLPIFSHRGIMQAGGLPSEYDCTIPRIG